MTTVRIALWLTIFAVIGYLVSLGPLWIALGIALVAASMFAVAEWHEWHSDAVDRLAKRDRRAS